MGIIHRPTEDLSAPCVVLCHGLFSSMLSPKLILLAGTLVKHGIATVRFDFRGCGRSGGNIRDTTVSGRVSDLVTVLGHLRGEEGLKGPFGLLGSSLGGYVALLAFAHREDLKGLCVWATPFDLADLSAMRTHPDLSALGPAFYEDIPHHVLSDLGDRLHHVLILHGENDEVIPKDHAIRLFEVVSEPKALHMFPGGDHRFSDSEHLNRAAELSLQWFNKHLARE